MRGPSSGLPAWANVRPISGHVPGLSPALWWRAADPHDWPAGLWDSWSREQAIEVVVDLRTPEETARHRVPTRPGLEWVPLPLIRRVLEEWSHPRDRTPEATARRYLEMAEEGQDCLTDLVVLAQSGRRLLFHCAAGRDRTGIAAAALLAQAGVPDAVIAADYALSDGVALDGAAAPAETMVRFLRLFQEQVGAWEGFLGSASSSVLFSSPGLGTN